MQSEDANAQAVDADLPRRWTMNQEVVETVVSKNKRANLNSKNKNEDGSSSPELREDVSLRGVKLPQQGQPAKPETSPSFQDFRTQRGPHTSEFLPEDPEPKPHADTPPEGHAPLEHRRRTQNESTEEFEKQIRKAQKDQASENQIATSKTFQTGQDAAAGQPSLSDLNLAENKRENLQKEQPNDPKVENLQELVTDIDARGDAPAPEERKNVGVEQTDDHSAARVVRTNLGSQDATAEAQRVVQPGPNQGAESPSERKQFRQTDIQPTPTDSRPVGLDQTPQPSLDPNQSKRDKLGTRVQEDQKKKLSEDKVPKREEGPPAETTGEDEAARIARLNEQNTIVDHEVNRAARHTGEKEDPQYSRSSNRDAELQSSLISHTLTEN